MWAGAWSGDQRASKMRGARWWRLAVLGAMVALTVAACGSGEPASPEDAADPAGEEQAGEVEDEGGDDEDAFPDGDASTVRIGTQPWIGYGPWYIAVDQGFDEANGLDVELVSFTTDQDLNSALAAGQMEGANMAAQTFLTLLARDADIRLVFLEDAAYEADAIIAGEEITEVSDLAGQQVAYEEGATSDILLRQALEDHGMTIADVEPVFTPAADAGAAAIAGRVPAAVTYEPYLTTAMAEDDSISIIYSGADAPGLISDLLAVGADFAEDNPDAVTALATVWEESLAFLTENPEEGREIIANAVGAPVDELETAFEGVEFYTLDDSFEQLADGGEYHDTLENINRILIEQGALDEEPDFASAISLEYLEAAR